MYTDSIANMGYMKEIVSVSFQHLFPIVVKVQIICPLDLA